MTSSSFQRLDRETRGNPAPMKRILINLVVLSVSVLLFTEVSARLAFLYPPARRRLLGPDSSSYRLNSSH